MKKSFTIHDLPPQERPRERLEKFGIENLSTTELLALILGRGIKGESILLTSQKILSKFGSLEALKEASIEDLKEIRGLGLAKAAQIQACFEVARRMNHGNLPDGQTSNKKQILSSKDVFNLIKPKIKNFSKEHFIVLSFDNRNKFIGMDTISVGTLNSNLVHPRETFEAAVRRHAAKIIIVHNHPSGDTDPSKEDLNVTKQLEKAGKIMGIEVLDHLIIGDGYKSIM
ncbi:MAG: DNA repair protein RadC [Candidatus Levybacteria bacterium]|nr:DNA repair protein RadC [Candidatus Levybacteria bacterium]